MICKFRFRVLFHPVQAPVYPAMEGHNLIGEGMSMFWKRIAAAVFMIVTAFLFRVCMPEQYAALRPLVREILAEEQVYLPDADTVEAWFSLG